MRTAVSPCAGEINQESVLEKIEMSLSLAV